MRKHILDVIKQVEKDYEVKILYACESGSRAWGYHTQDSDYDVRFIYVHKKNWYLSIAEKRDVLEIQKKDSLSIPVADCIDISGWELQKTLKLFRKSNPTLLEWLMSSIVYYDTYSVADKLRALGAEIFNPTPCIYHYLNMAKRNYRNYLADNVVHIKGYLNFLRPIFMAKWIARHHSVPPVKFNILLADFIPFGDLRDDIERIVRSKIGGEELVMDLNRIHQFLDQEILILDEYVKNLDIQIPDPTERLDQLFREVLGDAWTIQD